MRFRPRLSRLADRAWDAYLHEVRIDRAGADASMINERPGQQCTRTVVAADWAGPRFRCCRRPALVTIERKQPQSALGDLPAHPQTYGCPDHHITRPVNAQFDPAQADRQRKSI